MKIELNYDYYVQIMGEEYAEAIEAYFRAADAGRNPTYADYFKDFIESPEYYPLTPHLQDIWDYADYSDEVLEDCRQKELGW